MKTFLNKPAKYVYLSLLFILVINSGITFAQNEDLSVLRNWYEYTDRENLLYHTMTNQAIRLLQLRKEGIAELSTEAEWKSYQQKIKKKLMEIVGPFPEKTALKPQIKGVLHKDGYRLEKLIYESQPKFFVTAGLFIPENLTKKTPAIIYCSGHSEDAFRSMAYQRVILNLVKKGFIVFAFDPVSQGERGQYFDPDFGVSKIGGSTAEHSYSGAQCFLTGSSQARYMIWDGIRAVDYLLSRKEVDPAHIGITGRSGGGTQSSYIAAFDERILAAAPECYITSFQRLLESIGPQDAEQNFYHEIASAIDHADLLEVRAPKPAMQITTTRDFFSIQGARETAAEIERAYQALGKKENFQIIEDDESHASTKANRERLYAFFQKYLDLPGSAEEEEISYLSREETKITETGQVMTELQGETIFSLNLKEAENKLNSLVEQRIDSDWKPSDIIPIALQLSGYRKSATEPRAVFTGRFRRNNYLIEKYFIEEKQTYPLPFLLVKPENAGPFPVILYLHDEGKAKEAGPGGEIEWYVKKGYMVIAPDLPGRGEIGPERFRGDSYNFGASGRASLNTWFLAIHIAKSLAGIQTGDLIHLVDYVKSRPDVKINQIAGIARGEVCPVLTHAAAFDPSITKIALFNPLVSCNALVLNKYYIPKFMLAAVPGMLPAYDITDLYAALAPRKILLINVVNQINKFISERDLQKIYKSVHDAYLSKNAGNRFIHREMEFYHTLDDIMTDWLKTE